MSITQEAAKKHYKDPAIFCCYTGKGTVIGPAELEDPELFEEMEESGIITLSEDGLSI